MLNEEVFRKRTARFQRLMRENGIDASMIRTLSSFTYFTGIKWLRPSLLIPAEGEPTVFVFQYEAEEFAEKSWIKNLKTYRKVEELMKAVTGTIRQGGYKVVGFDYSLERDSYVLYFELFKKMNTQVEVRDVHVLIMQLRMIKDAGEIEAIKQASQIAEVGMKGAIDAIDVGVSELEVAAEAVRAVMRRGAENPRIYVTTGPKPRVHAEPRCWSRIQQGDVIEIVLATDYHGYYSNLTRTVFIGGPSEEKRKILDAFLEAHLTAEEHLKPGVNLLEIENMLKEIFERKDYGQYYVVGFTHGVGLLA
ncbi:MAG: Xaa-Pro peptidase family protein, partial [Candidatus Hadarchaeota archaeon]|nr:Xaa-Pro peptidase family protein [Candidatus Hadarchaeota archaeon]